MILISIPIYEEKLFHQTFGWVKISFYSSPLYISNGFPNE